MKPVAHVVFALLVAGVQASFLRFVGGGAFSLALLTPCLVYLGLHAGNVEGVLTAAAIGYVLDLLAGTPRGLMTFLGVVLFLLARAAGTAVDVRGRAAFGVLSGAGALFLSIASMVLLRYVLPPEAAPGARLLPRMLLEAFLTGFASPLVLIGMRAIDRRFHKEEPGLLG